MVPKGPIDNIPALVQIMAWRRPGDKPLSEPMMARLLTHICVTRPQWVNSNFIEIVLSEYSRYNCLVKIINNKYYRVVHELILCDILHTIWQNTIHGGYTKLENTKHVSDIILNWNLWWHGKISYRLNYVNLRIWICTTKFKFKPSGSKIELSMENYVTIVAADVLFTLLMCQVISWHIFL